MRISEPCVRNAHFLLNNQEETFLRTSLDTDKKTITVPWNYAQKLDEMNRIVAEAGGGQTTKWDFKNYIDKVWKDCMDNSDKCLKVADKPISKRK